MGSLHRRIKSLEARGAPCASSGECPPWRSPEQHASREQQFRRLFMQLGMGYPPASRDPTQVLDEQIAMINASREETRKEQSNND